MKPPRSSLRLSLSRSILLSLSLSVRAYASHEDITSFAAAAAMGQAWTAVPGSVGSLGFNPAGIGPITTPEFGAGYGREFQIPAGRADLEQMSSALALPVDIPEVKGTFGFSWANTLLTNAPLDHMLGVSYASRGWKEFDSGFLDAGITLKGLTRSGRSPGGSVTRGSVDIGLLYRMNNSGAFGASLLNVNGPRMEVGGVPDRAPVMLKAGYSQAYRNFTMALDVTKREPSSGYPSGQSLGAGLQYWWNTARAGSFAGRTGLNMSQGSKSWSVGAGWRVLGGEADYALIVPLDSTKRWSQAVTLIFRFGSWNPEQEYEKMLGSELRYRQDLTRALESADAKQQKLATQLTVLRGEIQSLRSELADRTEAESQAKIKLRIFEERQRRAQQALDEIQSEKDRLSRRSKESLFREDWEKYRKLKADGAPDVMLLERVQQILREYKGAGVDVSDPSQELLRLQRNRSAP